MFSWRLLLLPFSWIYLLIVGIRNKLFDWKIYSSYKIPGSSICIGNITVGGTGKSPHTAYLADLLKKNNPVILSRGYGRKTKGLVVAGSGTTANDIGDEPFMYWESFHHQVPVVVSEKRKTGVDYLRKNYPESPILLDDAFQHRAVKAGLNILCMTYDRPVFEDFVFPAGNLRESRSGMKRADLVFITKCPAHVPENQKKRFYKHIPLPENRIFFSEIVYGEMRGLFGDTWEETDELLIVTGIAQPEPLYRFLREKYKITSIRFPDHYDFNDTDLQRIQQKVATFAGKRIPVIITEKDASKWISHKAFILEAGLSVFVQKMRIQLDREDDFKALIRNYVVSANERGC